MMPKERPDVEVLDAICAVYVVKGCALAKRHGQNHVLEGHVAGVSMNELLDVCMGNLAQSLQVRRGYVFV